MPVPVSALVGSLQAVVRWGLLLLGFAGLVAALVFLVRWLTRRWQARANTLAAQLDSGLAALDHTVAHLRTEADTYPPDTPDPYGPLVEQLVTTLARIERDHTSLHDGLAAVRAEAIALPDASWAKVGYWLWREPRHRWRQRNALTRLVQELASPRAQAEAAGALLKELRSQPLETSMRVRALYELVETSQHTVGSLQAAGVQGTPLEAADAALKTYRKTLQTLPVYLFAGTESQIVRRARPSDIADAWGTVAALAPAIEQTAEQAGAWQQAYEQAEKALESMCQTVAQTRARFAEIPDALDVTELAEAWKQTEADAEALVACYEAPTTEDLAAVERIATTTEAASALAARLSALDDRQATLKTGLARNEEALTQIEQQLRQLADAGRYPLDRVPLQVVADQLHQQARKIGGPQQRRTPAQLEAALSAAEELAHRAQDLATRVAEIREQRRRLIELLDQQAAAPQVDWMTWARDLHERTHLYAADNWFSSDGLDAAHAVDALQKPNEGLRVHGIVADAERLAERHKLWMPARVDDPLAPQELERRINELTALFAETERFQDRLDQITQRFQVCQEAEEAAKSDLATVYGALDRLDIVAADVLPPALAKEENHWTRIRERLDEGYELELALGNPGLGTVHEKAARVTRWIEASRHVLTDWQKVLTAELATTSKALNEDLDKLMAIAPLGDEPAVVQAREAAESQVDAPKERRRLGGRMQGRSQQPEVRDPSASKAALVGAQLAREVADQLRTLAHLDRTLAALRSEVLVPLAEPVAQWRDGEQRSETAFEDLQRLETASARLWPPLSCDTATVKARFDLADQARDSLYQDGTTVSQVLATVTALTEHYNQIVTMVEQRDAAYHAQRLALDATLDQLERWCAQLERYRDEHAGDDAIAAAIRARLDEIEAGWTQLQIRYEQAPDLVPGEEAQRTLNDLWRQAHRVLPLGPGLDVLTAEEVEGR
ncbi:MAG: hypothetical protein JXC32_17650 [Anaerolineae bacterium]|nr:hypothetical protein [Anaerolineae bacterium]